MSTENLSKKDLLKKYHSAIEQNKYLHEENQKLVSLLSEAPIPYQSLDVKGRFLDVNEAFLQETGYERHEVIGKEFCDFLQRGYKTAFTRAFSTFKKGGEMSQASYRLVRKDGSSFEAAYTSHLTRDPEGNLRTHCIFRNVPALDSEREKIKRHMKLRDKLLDTALDGFILADDVGQIVDVNASYCRMTGYTREELVSMNIRQVEVKIPPELVQERIERMVRQGYDRFETKHKTKDGRILELDVSIVVFSDDTRTLVAAFVRDITDYNRVLRALEESEQKLRSVLYNSTVGISLVDETGVITDWNPRLESITGLKAGEVIGRKIWNVQYQLLPQARRSPAVLADLEKSITGYLQTGKLPDYFKSMESTYERPDGTQRYITGSVYAIKTAAGFMLCSTTQDVTEARRIAEELEAAKMRFESLFYKSPVPLWEEDFTEVLAFLEKLRKRGVKNFGSYLEKHPEIGLQCAGMIKVLDVNQAVLNLYDARSKDELLGNLDKLFTPDSYPMFQQELVAIAEGKRLFRTESTVKTLSGREITIAVHVTLGYGKDIHKAVVATIDITDRKKAEKALAESEKKYKLLAETTRDLIILHDMDGTIFYANQSALNLAGTESPNIIGRNICDFIPEEYQADLFKRKKKRQKGIKATLSYQMEFSNAAGQRLPVDVQSTPIIENGQVSSILIVARDIRERIEAEKAIKAGNELFRKSFYMNPNIMIMVDVKTRQLVDVNQAYTRKIGYSASEVCQKPGKLGFRLADKKDLETIISILEKENRLTAFEATVYTRSGAKLDVLLFAEPLYIQDKLLHVVTAVDITERKKAEAALKRSERKFRFMANRIADVIWDYDLASRQMVYISPSVKSLLGYSVREAMEGPLEKILSPEFRSLIGKVIKDMAAGYREGKSRKKSHRFEVEATTKTGKTKWVEASVSLVFDENKKVVGLTGVSRDITDRKRME